MLPARLALCKISIHALREESDVGIAILLPKLTLFQSTPSARRATDTLYRSGWNISIFQSTPSARRATCFNVFFSLGKVDFNPRPPRGERPSCPTTRR